MFLIEELWLDVLVKGVDYIVEIVVGSDFVRLYGGVVKFVELEEGYSIIGIIYKIQMQLWMVEGIIIVMGGVGFIGFNIVVDLCDDYDVVVCDWLGIDDKWKNVVKCDLVDFVFFEQLNDFLLVYEDEVEVIVYMGVIFLMMECDVDFIFQSNFQFFKYLWEWCGCYFK